jgi:hypothetical protein
MLLSAHTKASIYGDLASAESSRSMPLLPPRRGCSLDPRVEHSGPVPTRTPEPEDHPEMDMPRAMDGRCTANRQRAASNMPAQSNGSRLRSYLPRPVWQLKEWHPLGTHSYDAHAWENILSCVRPRRRLGPASGSLAAKCASGLCDHKSNVSASRIKGPQTSCCKVGTVGQDNGLYDCFGCASRARVGSSHHGKILHKAFNPIQPENIGPDVAKSRKWCTFPDAYEASRRVTVVKLLSQL